jgi:hypothetical protein
MPARLRLIVRPCSITIARVDHDILPGRVAVITTALRQIVAGTGRSRCANQRSGRAADNGAGNRTTRPAGQRTPEDAADQRAANRARGGVRRWTWGRRWRGRRVASDRGGRWIASSGRRRIAVWTGRRPFIGIGIVGKFDVRHVGRRTVEPLRIEIPCAADVPPPAVAAIANLVTPAAATPGEFYVNWVL